jgi:hypothetical protein
VPPAVHRALKVLKAAAVFAWIFNSLDSRNLQSDKTWRNPPGLPFLEVFNSVDNRTALERSCFNKLLMTVTEFAKLVQHGSCITRAAKVLVKRFLAIEGKNEIE